MKEYILEQPHQLADALWRVDAADVPRREMPGGLLVCGMGGSAVGGDLAAAAIGRRAARPIRTLRGYDPEPWLSPDPLVLCASYSGSTEETLACFDAAASAGASRAVITTGGPLAERAREQDVPVIGVPSGMEPRASVVYMTVAAFECAALCGAAPPVREEIEGAAATLAELARDSSEAEEIAEVLHGTMPVVHGAEQTAPIARRWKTQLNENAKVAAFASELPEANHNEIEGWAWGREHAPMSAVFLEAPGTHPRVERRIELTVELLERQDVPVVRVDARGERAVAHVLSLVMLGDLVSVELAERSGADPIAVKTIEGFKRELG